MGTLSDSKISVSPESEKEKYTLGQRAADSIAKFAGSWAFIFSFTGVLILWMVVNTVLAAKAFDPYPFILLNLVLSCVAAIQAPLIMMSQNRQEEKDRRRAENDSKVNLKTEIMIEDLYDKVNAILAKRSALERMMNREARDTFGKRGANMMKTDVKQTDNGYEVAVDLPGCKKEDIHAKFEDGVLHVELPAPQQTKALPENPNLIEIE